MVYPHHGAGQVIKKEEKDILGEVREYLTIKILHNDMTVMVPCENAGKAGLRRVIDEETVKKVLAVLSDDVSEMPKNWNRRFKHNRDKIKTGDIYELAEVVRNLAIREQDKGLSTGEKQMYTRAKKILASELMYALEKAEEQAEAYLDELLQRSGEEKLAGSRKLPAGHATWRSPSWWPRAVANALAPDRPKAFVVLAGRPMLEWSRRRAAGGGDRATIVVALPPGEAAPDGLRRACAGGATRSESVRARAGGGARRGRRSSSTTPRGRSCARSSSPTRWRRSADADAAIAAARVTDTVKEAGRRPPRRPPRSTARACGRSRRRRRSAATSLERALDVDPATCSPRATDDAWLVERAGGSVVAVVESTPENFKVTTPHDLQVAELLLGDRVSDNSV